MPKKKKPKTKAEKKRIRQRRLKVSSPHKVHKVSTHQQGKKIEYPIATVAYYGPDNQFASKVVAAIIEKEGGEPTHMEKWYADGLDVREDSSIKAQIMAFMAMHGARTKVSSGIIGCPHEEGIDYPEGEACPQCPWWKNRNRFTHEMEQ